MSSAPAPAPRIVSLDQFRGYTVAGMLLVNFLGGFRAIPAILKHHNTYCSYADTIMPQFFFAVGFAYRLTFLKRLERTGAGPAYGHAISRNLGLILLGVLVYHLDGEVRTWDELARLGVRGALVQGFQREPFQTLVHIGLASLWVLPVIGRGAAARIGWALAAAAGHAWLSQRFYHDWVWNRPGIDGGPLGFLTWSIPILVGSLAYDVIAALGPGRAVARLAGWAAGLMVLGYGLSCLGGPGLAPPPFVPPTSPPNPWAMSQRTGSVSYLVFATGFALLVDALFVAACDVGRLSIGVFRTFGRNALVVYLLQDLVGGGIQKYMPNDAPLWYVACGFGLYFGLMYLFARHLEREGLFLRI